MSLTATFRRLFAKRDAPKADYERPRIVAQEWPAAVYAIGDVHGCLAQLKLLEELIVADAKNIVGKKWIVLLGDYVDRGPDACGVIDHLLSPPPEGFERYCIAGNHETMMLEFLYNPRLDATWLDFGGTETLASYGLDVKKMRREGGRAFAATVTSFVPREHLDFVKSAPLFVSLPGTLLVHAGIRPGLPIEEQLEEDLLWIRAPFLDAVLPSDIRVVHGHTPSKVPVVTPSRICVDTGAYATGNLTAAKLTPSSCTFISTRAAVRPEPTRHL